MKEMEKKEIKNMEKMIEVLEYIAKGKKEWVDVVDAIKYSLEEY